MEGTLLDIPFKIARSIKQGTQPGRPLEAFSQFEKYEEADRAGSLSERYGQQIQAIRQAANSGAPEALPAAWKMLQAFRVRAVQDRVRPDDFDRVFEPLRSEVATATRAQLGLQDPTNVVRQGLMEGEKASELATPLSTILKNQSAAGLSNARARRVSDLLPFEQQSEAALAQQRAASAGASNAQAGLYGAQASTLVPAQVDATKALGEQRRRIDPGDGTGAGAGGDVGKLSPEAYTRAYGQVQRSLPNFQGAPLAEKPEAAQQTLQGLEAQVDSLNELARKLNSAGYRFGEVELRTVKDARGNERVILRPRGGDQATSWDPAAQGPPPAEQPPGRPSAPPMIQAPELPGPPAPAEAPSLPPPDQGAAAAPPGNVTDISALLGPLAGALQQGQTVPKSALRAQLQQQGIVDRQQQDAVLGQLESIYGRANAAAGR